MKMMRRIVALASFAALSAPAATRLLPGSINFDDPALWDKTVQYGLNDDGTMGGETHWYFGNSTETSKILRRTGTVTGYLSAYAMQGVYRAIDAITDPEGPAASGGRLISADGLYIDTELTLPAYHNKNGVVAEPSVDLEKDKLIIWTYSNSEDGSASATLMVAAGRLTDDGEIVRTNIVTSLSGITSGERVRLTLRAKTGVDLDNGYTGVGFEIFVNGAKVTHGDGCGEFPSLQQSFAGESAARTRSGKVYSLGFTGHSEVDVINFTQINPIENPDYDKDDLSMLQECAEITVNGASSDLLIGFPLLVRISEDRVPGFYYSCARSDGSDIRFTDENGRLVPHEIDVWNDADGESYLWVKPSLVQRGTKLTMHWNLATGGVLPSVDSTAVWSDYAAVWHMNSLGTAVKDSTGHGFTATVNGGATLVEGTNSVIGRAAALAFVDGRHGLECASLESALDSTGAFTFSGWFVGNGYSNDVYTTTAAIYGSKGVTNSLTKADGWAGRLQSETKHRYYLDGSTYLEDSGLADVSTNWYHTTLSYSETGVCRSYFNGVAGARVSGAKITGTSERFLVMADGMMADEVRVARVVRSERWLATEIDQMTDDSFATASAAQPKGSVNYWLEEPSVTPTSWSPDEASTVVLTMGRARFGTVIVTYSDDSGALSYDFPTEPGVYKALFEAGDGVVHQRITKTVNLVIYEKQAYRQLSGHDRVMLFNSDLTPGCEITLQGFWDVDSKTNLVWSHTSEPWQGTGPFVQDGAFHVYREPETGIALWQFRHARIGNLYPSDAVELVEGRNLLPWNAAYARRYDDSDKPANRQRYAGWLMLQNVSGEEDPAAAYSPIYSNGVGTVYFDAVNAYTAFTNVLKVQICHTAAADGLVQEGSWVDAPLTVLKVTDGLYDAAGTVSNALSAALAMTASEGSTNAFYRVRAVVDSTEPTRLRIVRTDSSWGTAGVDGDGLAIVDNIIVSAPAMGVRISQYGAPAISGDAAFRGWRAPFSVPFPAVSDIGRLKAMAKVEYIVNGTNTADAAFLGSLMMRYRWRYLSQAMDDWQDVVLRASDGDMTRFVSTDPLVARGLGDIEYSFTGVVNAPYYDFVDYSGLALNWPDGFTERRGNVEINAKADGVYSDSNLSPALGTDYFIRLREGASAYERMTLRVRRGKTVDTVPMSVVFDGTWRGFWMMPTNEIEAVEWQIEADNRQADGGGDYQWSTNYYHATSDATELPVNDGLVAGSADGWSKVPSDAVTGYLMFQVDETTRALTIIHADYQNMNAWSDANRADGDINGHFVGTSTADNSKAGVSRMVRSYAESFENLSPTVATNPALWEEHFDVQPSTEGEYAIEVPFSTQTTPNGWGADNGMWMPQEYRNLDGESIALQLEGEGRGRLRFSIANSPRGVATFSYRARNAQAYDIFSFDYYRGTNEYYGLYDYTFAVPCVMRHGTHGDFEGLGSVSAVGYYDDGRGCYEARVDRVSEDEVKVYIYKWYVSGSKIVSELLAESTDTCEYMMTGLNGQNACGAILISCENNESEGHTRITAGVYIGTKITRADVANQVLSGKLFMTAMAIDDAENRHTCGTFGVGSKNCPASFAAPQLYMQTVEWSTTSKRKLTFDSSPSIKQLLIDDEDGYDDWTIRQGRLEAKEQIDRPMGWGFVAVESQQTMKIEVAPKSTQNYQTVAENEVSSFGFESFTNSIYVAETIDVRVTTGGTRGDGSGEVMVDDFVAEQWRGNSYDDGENRSSYGNVNRGAPTNFVYTTAWVHEQQGIELSAMRTIADSPASIRAPLMDGKDDRGLGLGMFVFSYAEADANARLLVQIATNGLDVTTLADYTSRFDGWETVKTIDFSKFSEVERSSGMVSCYIGLHGVAGVMRIVVDPELVTAASDEGENPGHDPYFGSVRITAVSARDNPSLDKGSWWGWNLRTTDDSAFQLLEDGAHEPASWGLSCALNNSVTDDVRVEDGDLYPKHPPFLQTPVFSKGAVGQLSFKARKYSSTDPSPTITVYGTTKFGTLTEDSDFEPLGEVVVTSERFERYDFTASITKNYTGFRLVVTGVAGVENPGEAPSSGYVERVLIDEVAVFEAVRTRMGFRNVGAFRNSLASLEPIANMPSVDEQPMCDEPFGIQAELYVSQLANAIDTTREPEVYLHWYAGSSPWGYSQWAGKGTSAKLERVGGSTNWIYRSTYATGDGSIIPAQPKAGQIVQYSLDVVFYMKDSDDPLTNTLSSAEWSTPEWYSPVDYNASLGRGDKDRFSAYTILDSVAYGWAWFNEVNVYGDRVNYSNTDAARQYIEIAAPVEADLSGWYVQLLTPETSSGSVITNKLAIFGTPALSAKKKQVGGQYLGQASNMVFRVIANQATRDAGELKTADGTLDGVWSVQEPCSAIDSDGTISYYQGFGLQLLRPSGVVEHEIVAIGTNLFATSINRSQYHPTNVVKFLNAHVPQADFLYVGDDDGGLKKSLGVVNSHGEVKSVWTNSLDWTPGRINIGQVIDPDHPTPSGDSILIYANLGSDHISQSVDPVIVLRKGSDRGTNIIYAVDRWYEIGSVTTNGAPAGVVTNAMRTYVVNVGRGCSNSVTVVASAVVNEQLRNLGCDENNRYTPAILKWLEEAVDIDGNEWPEGDRVYLADYVALYGSVVTNLTLTQMYWLDMCPTITNQCLIAGMAEAPTIQIKPPLYDGTIERTNLTMTVYMMMSNRTEDTSSKYYGKAWKPTVLRGLDPGSHSRDYKSATEPWTNETFKITGLLANGLTSESNDRNWIPVRFFVFDENSFNDDGTTVIQVADPHSSASPGYGAGWGDWFRRHPEDDSPIFFSWAIDTRLMPITVELLKKNNPL